MSFRFKPEDFLLSFESSFIQEIGTGQVSLERVARQAITAQANRLLDAHIATLPEVKGWNQDDDLNTVIWFPKKNADYQSTHRARLWGLEEIKQKKCEPHEMHVTFVDGLPTRGRCNKCGQQLIAKWEEV